MKIVIVPVLLLSLVLVLASCAQGQDPGTSGRDAQETPEREIVDWYQEARAVMADRTPGASGCERHRSEYFLMVDETHRLLDEGRAFQAAMTRLKEESPQSDHEQIDEMAIQRGGFITSSIGYLIGSFQASAGWNDDALDHCAARFDAERNPDLCNQLLVTGEGFPDYVRFGYAEYCIENRVAPFGN